MKNPWVVIGVIVVLLIGGSVWYSIEASKAYNEGVVVTEHIKGNPDATVTLTEYSDFQCPACSQFAPIVAEIMAEYGDSIRFEYKHFPLIQLHPFAQPAARAAEAAGQQGKFFEFHDLLFANQAEWTKGVAPAAFFTQYAEELGLDLDLFAKHQRSSLLQDKVKREFDEARGLGLTGTPSFYLNGVRMNPTSIDDFKAQVAAAVNPTANFNLNAGDETIKLVPATPEDGTGTTSVVVPPSGAPAVQFGI